MHKSPSELFHSHRFSGDNSAAGNRIGLVIAINGLVMIGEIIAGTLFGSIALVADGWHMGTHIIALGITLIAYKLAGKWAQDTKFAFGSWKIEVLGGYTSALLLGIAGISMFAASVERLVHPVAIRYDQALAVAVIGLVVNMAGAVVLGHHHHKHDGNDREGSNERHPVPDHHPTHDINMHAAYVHILTDALTSVLAIAAILSAKYLSLTFFDPVAGIMGAVLILRWTVLLLAESGNILLDRETDQDVTEFIRTTVESDGTTKVTDLHVWKVATGKYACIIVLLTRKDGHTIADFKNMLAVNNNIVHSTVELHYLSH